MNLWQWIGLGVAGGAGVVASLAGAPVWVGILGGAVFGSAVAGRYYFYTDQQELRRRMEEANNAITRLQTEKNRLKQQIEGLQTQLQAVQQNNVNLQQTLSTIQNDLNATQQQIDHKDVELSEQSRIISRLRRELEERGGNGTRIASDSNYYYASTDIDSCLQQAVLNRLGGFAKGCKYLLTQDVMSSTGIKFKTVLFPAINSGTTGLIRLMSLLDSTELLHSLPHITAQNGIKIVFPYLDLSYQHWNSAEWQITQSVHGYKINCYLHNPRGGKDSVIMSEEIRMHVEKKLRVLMPDKELEFKYLPSPFETCRQSKPDKISCGPIVAKEIELRILEKSLDRTIPYEFGAWEIVAAQQSETKNLQSLAKSRHHFLAADRRLHYPLSRSAREGWDDGAKLEENNTTPKGRK